MFFLYNNNKYNILISRVLIFKCSRDLRQVGGFLRVLRAVSSTN